LRWISTKDPRTFFCPAPDLTGLFDKILNLEKKDSYPGLDDDQINASFHDKDSVLFNSKRLYQILQHDIQPLSKKEKQDLHRWMTRDVISDNPDALPDFLGLATQVVTYTLMQDEMLTNVKSVSGKYCKEGDIEPSRKKGVQLVTMFCKRSNKEMSSFPFSLKYGDVVNPVTFQVAILFAVHI
jgi:hypothetical protein